MISTPTGLLPFTTKAWQRNQTLAAFLLPVWIFIGLPFTVEIGLPSALLLGVSTVLSAWSYVVARDLFRPLKGVVGVDGVRMVWRGAVVFLAFTAIDEVRREEDEIALVRAGEVLSFLRFSHRQASVAEAVETRIRLGVQRVQEMRASSQASLVAGSSAQALAEMARGESDYRTTHLTRAQLFELVEGPELDGGTRSRVASALAATADEEERRRLRVAAEGCADPKVRIAAEALARTEPEPRAAERRSAT